MASPAEARAAELDEHERQFLVRGVPRRCGGVAEQDGRVGRQRSGE